MEPYTELQYDSLTYKSEIGINVHHKDKEGWTILLWACQNDTTPLDVLSSLIEMGAELN